MPKSKAFYILGPDTLYIGGGGYVCVCVDPLRLSFLNMTHNLGTNLFWIFGMITTLRLSISTILKLCRWCSSGMKICYCILMKFTPLSLQRLPTWAFHETTFTTKKGIQSIQNGTGRLVGIPRSCKRYPTAAEARRKLQAQRFTEQSCWMQATFGQTRMSNYLTKARGTTCQNASTTRCFPSSDTTGRAQCRPQQPELNAWTCLFLYKMSS